MYFVVVIMTKYKVKREDMNIEKIQILLSLSELLDYKRALRLKKFKYG